jgi:hypothetical protein
VCPTDNRVRCETTAGCEGRTVAFAVTDEEAVTIAAVRQTISDHLRDWTDWQAQAALRSLSETIEALP